MFPGILPLAWRCHCYGGDEGVSGYATSSPRIADNFLKKCADPEVLMTGKPNEATDEGRQGPLSSFLSDDHRRLDTLFQSAVRDPQLIDGEAYDRFRAGLLRHIGMEEKILLPALQRLRGGTPFDHAARLRLDHGALAALLMPTPTTAIVATIRHILAAHNELEEGPGGLYAVSDELAASEADTLIARLRAAPVVRVMPCSDSPAVMNNLRGTLKRAGYHLANDQLPPTELKSGSE